MTQQHWSLLIGKFAHSHPEDDRLAVAHGSSHFHSSAPMGHRHTGPGTSAEVYDRLGTARWLMTREVAQIRDELGLGTTRHD